MNCNFLNIWNVPFGDEPREPHEFSLLLQDFKRRESKLLQKMFKEYVDPKSKFASMNNFILILRDIFEDRSDVIRGRFYLNKTDKADDDIFHKTNSFKTVLKKIEEYIFDVLGIDSTLYKTVKDINIDFNFFFSILAYLVESNGIFILKKIDMSNSEEHPNEGLDLLTSLKATLETYETKKVSCKSDVEERILESTINGIRAQILSLEYQNSELPIAKQDSKRRDQSIQQALNKVFEHYSKLQKAPKRDSTLEQYSTEQNTMYAGEWIKFCNDFGLSSKNINKKVRTLTYNRSLL